MSWLLAFFVYEMEGRTGGYGSNQLVIFDRASRRSVLEVFNFGLQSLGR